MRKGVLLFTAAFLLGTGTTGLSQTAPTLKKITAFDLPGLPENGLTTWRLMRTITT